VTIRLQWVTALLTISRLSVGAPVAAKATPCPTTHHPYTARHNRRVGEAGAAFPPADELA
jgi:hypothetical protein